MGRGGEELRTTVIEAPRLAAEELAADAPAPRALPWWEPLDPQPGAQRRGSDRPRAGELDVATDLMAARSALTEPEIERYRSLSRDTAAATGAALRDATPADTEFALAGRAAQHLYERAVEPVVMLVAGADRLPLHRHPLPTTAPLGARAMLVVCGRRHGLVTAVTRMRAFTPLRDQERDRYSRLLAVEAAFLDATRAGARIGDIVAAGTPPTGQSEVGHALEIPAGHHVEHAGGRDRAQHLTVERADLDDRAAGVLVAPEVQFAVLRRRARRRAPARRRPRPAPRGRARGDHVGGVELRRRRGGGRRARRSRGCLRRRDRLEGQLADLEGHLDPRDSAVRIT